MPLEQILSSPAGAVLGVIAFVAVMALALTVKQLLERPKNGNGHKETRDEAVDRVTKILALIERERLEMPENWRKYMEWHWHHRMGAERMRNGVIERLVRGGDHTAARQLIERLDQTRDRDEEADR